MFPEAPSSGMMVLTVTQKTQNDMTSWCADVEHEREQMLAKVSYGQNTFGWDNAAAIEISPSWVLLKLCLDTGFVL